MPSTFGQWLIVILALLVGLLGGWVLASRRPTTGPTESIVKGDPVAGVNEVPPPVTAVVDQGHPAAVVDEAPAPAAVTDEPAPAEYDAPPAAATLAANATPLPSGDTADEHLDETRGDAEPVHVEEPATAEPLRVHEPAAVEPVHVEEPVAAAVESAGDDTPAASPATVVAEAEPAVPAGQDAPEAEEDATPAVVPAPRPAVEDTFTPVATTTPTEPETAVASTNGVVAANGTGPGETADDFRRIQGIGPKLAAALQAAGIRTYRQLGDLDEAALRETVRAAGLRAAASLAAWPQQARVLAGARAEADQVLPAGTGEDA